MGQHNFFAYLVKIGGREILSFDEIFSFVIVEFMKTMHISESNVLLRYVYRSVEKVQEIAIALQCQIFEATLTALELAKNPITISYLRLRSARARCRTKNECVH